MTTLNEIQSIFKENIAAQKELKSQIRDRASIMYYHIRESMIKILQIDKDMADEVLSFSHQDTNQVEAPKTEKAWLQLIRNIIKENEANNKFTLIYLLRINSDETISFKITIEKNGDMYHIKFNNSNKEYKQEQIEQLAILITEALKNFYANINFIPKGKNERELESIKDELKDLIPI